MILDLLLFVVKAFIVMLFAMAGYKAIMKDTLSMMLEAMKKYVEELENHDTL